MKASGASSKEVGEHVLTVVDGRIRHDKIWRCTSCGAERVDDAYFTEFDCDPNASVHDVRENSRNPGNVQG